MTLTALALLSLSLAPQLQHDVAWTSVSSDDGATRQNLRATEVRVDGATLVCSTEPTASAWVDAAVVARQLTRNGDEAWGTTWPIPGPVPAQTRFAGFHASASGQTVFAIENQTVRSTVVSLQANGSLAWTHDLGFAAGSLIAAQDVRLTEDGGAIVVGRSPGQGVVVRKLDPSGAETWTSVIGQATGDGVALVRAASGGGYRVLEQSPNSAGNLRFMLYSLSLQGVINWTSTQPSSERKSALMFEVDASGFSTVTGRQTVG